MLDAEDINKIKEINPFFEETLKSIFNKFNEENVNFGCATHVLIKMILTFSCALAEIGNITPVCFFEFVSDVIKEALKKQNPEVLH
jgi:hypothetical protein